MCRGPNVRFAADGNDERRIMGEIGSIGQVLELAIIREIQAADACMILASRSENPQLQSVLEQLADAELDHKARLELELMKEGIVVKTVDANFCRLSKIHYGQAENAV
jgi:hypothetical protein